MSAFRSRGVTAIALGGIIGVAIAITTAVPADAVPDTSQTFSATGAVQTWAVPSGITHIYVDMAGGQGGASYGGGGLGAELTGTLSVTPGETLHIVAGGAGGDGDEYGSGAGGGGGSFIYTTANQVGLLAAAGGGGGAGSNDGPASSGSTGTSGGDGGNGGGAGGTAGDGGQAGSGGGGGGLLSNGAGAGGGQSLANGADGGPGGPVAGYGNDGGAGGFGGGSGTAEYSGGGGGGYSGGGGGDFDGFTAGGGGGGGSYFSGTLTGALSDQAGNGFVTIFYPSLSPSTLPKGQIGVAYSSQVTASGGTSPYSYAITSGALPDGITLDPTSGTLTGTPTVHGSFSFTVTATDAVGNAPTATYTLVVLPVVLATTGSEPIGPVALWRSCSCYLAAPP
jgi:hypothetical protein